MPLYLFYTMVQKIKNDQKLKLRGPALNSTNQGDFFSTLLSLQSDQLSAWVRTKVVSFFMFFRELSNQKKLRSYDHRWLK